MALIFLLGSLSGSFIGSPRYAIQAFPGFIAIAMYLSEHSKMRIPAFLLSILLGFILTALYFNGYFVS
jgi:hypothetical protein